MPFDIWGQPLREGHCEAHPDMRHRFQDDACHFEDIGNDIPWPRREPEPRLEDLCAPHPYHGDDGRSGRCYCGTERYPLGGPPIFDVMEVTHSG